MNADAVLTVDLDALARNYRILRATLRSGACAAVVKADAYGLGASAVARRLIDEGCSSFFVATLEEGVALRAALGRMPRIFVLNGIPSGSESCAADACLIPVLNSLQRLVSWRREAARRDSLLLGALQFDSGMTRLGMPEQDVSTLANDPAATAGVQVILVMSHLACADEPHHEANATQAAAFGRMRALFPDVPASLANSSGIFLGPGFHMDLARPGAALFGINPEPLRSNPMHPVVTLKVRVIQTHTVSAETAVGYGHEHRTSASGRLAVLGIGYADGWRRNSALGARFEGAALPLAGRVSMDSITVDASSITDGRLTEGAWVSLVDSEQTVDVAAKAAGTIGYEILCALGTRVRREYEAI